MIDLTPFTTRRYGDEYYTFTGVRPDQSVTYHVIHPASNFEVPDGPYEFGWLVRGRMGRVPPVSDPRLNILRSDFFKKGES